MHRANCILFCVAALVAAGWSDSALAKGGKGGGRGGGNGFSRPNFGGGPKFSGPKLNDAKPAGNHGPNWSDKQGKLTDKPGQLTDKKESLEKLAKKDGLDDEAFNKKQKQLDIEQRNRDKRLAQADHLRQITERTGNQNLAANADRMEAFAHDHYARRVAQLEKFGVTDPALDPGGVIDPLNDPAGEFPVLPDLPDVPSLPELPRILLPRLLP